MKVFTSFLLAFLTTYSLGQSEPSTYFNIYVPPNNSSIQRNVSLVVTAVNDSTHFTILDDDQDGDSDDNVSGVLMAGQSYILYIKDNGINDDALYASGGVLKRDGDYFIIQSDQLIYASMSTDSDWQHDFVPSVNKKSIGQKFFIYAPKISSSLRDLNVFAYENNTKVTISKISSSPTTQTGYTNVDINNSTIVIDRMLNPGEDLIHFFTEGRNCLETGGTYLIQANKDVSVQYGSLWQNTRDGGSYVPSGTGSSSGELFYFAVPYQSVGEQEIRIVSLDSANTVSLSRFDNGSWVSMNNWNLSDLAAAEWVGKANGNVSYPTVFRVSCSPGKKVTVFEANWMETGYNTTSDMATMVSSDNGTSSGTNFLTYMLPPSLENNAVNPFTGNFFDGSYSHFYLFAGNENTTVTIKDVKTNGVQLNKTYQISAGEYADAFFSINEWKSIYNGTGTTVGPDRPYVRIESTNNISVLMSNFNDNWMTYFGSSLPQSFTQNGAFSQNEAIPGDTVTLTSNLELENGILITNPDVQINVGSGLKVLASVITNTTNNSVVNGTIEESLNETKISYVLQDSILVTDNYQVSTDLVVSSSYNTAEPVADGTVLTVETKISGNVDGVFQQSLLSKGIQNNAENTSNLLFSSCHSSSIGNVEFDSWNGAWIDYDQDGWEDLFLAGRDNTAGNELYRNVNGTGFSKITSSAIVNAVGKTSAAIWGDINNDGNPDVLLVNETQKRSELYLNTGNGQFNLLANSGIDIQPQYFHGAAFADFDNDGFLDIIITNFFATKFHQLYRNQGDNTFVSVLNTPITAESNRATAPILADYNNDGWVDVFIANGDHQPNSLFKNIGGFQFEKVVTGDIVSDSLNGVGGAWGDYTNDGFLDLFVVNSSNENNALYKNNGDGTFTTVQNIAPVLDLGHSHSASWVDVNNDGFIDLYVTNDVGAKYLYLNDGNEGFSNANLEIVASNFGSSSGAAWADYNRDGQMDVAVFTHGNEKNKLFCNNGTLNNWIAFDLKGNASNRMALGARVRIKSGNIWQETQVLPVSGFGSQNSKKVHFGLGDNTSVDSVIVHWPSGVVQNVTNVVVNTFNLILEDDSKKLVGTVFLDENANGLKDSNEVSLQNVALRLEPTGTNFVSHEDGSFTLNIIDSLISFSVKNTNVWILTNTSSYSLSSVIDTIFVDIALQAINYEPDLAVSFGTTAWRRGFENNTIITAKNEGSADAYGVALMMNYPNYVSVVDASANYSASGGVYTFLIDTIKSGAYYTLEIIDSVGLEVSTGDVLNLSAAIQGDVLESNMTNNTYTEQLIVVGALDPNDIAVSPLGEGVEGFVNMDDYLTYTIRFENVGSWPATYVNIVNELSSFLDVETIEFVGSSHDVTYTIDQENRIIINYNRINLPPVELDSAGAQGYFKYRIRPKKTNQGGEEIYSQAAITFDFEAPVITNTVLNTIRYFDYGVSKHLFVYPNPSNGFITIEAREQSRSFEDLSGLKRIEIVNSFGMVVLQEDANGASSLRVNVEGLSSGVYQIRAVNSDGHTLTGKFIKI